MKIIHISLLKDRESILENGLVVSFQCPLHDIFCEKLDLDKKKGLLFGLQEGSNKQGKYIKDFVYWKLWGNPRNIFLKDKTYEKFMEFYEIGPSKLFSFIEDKDEEFAIWEAELEKENFKFCYHAQFPEMGELWIDMDSRFEHYQKPLVVVNDNVKKVRQIGDASCVIGKDKRYNIMVRI